MELTVFLKMLFDAAVFLEAAGYILSLFTPVTGLTVPALLAALGAGLAYLTRERSAALRFAPVLIGLGGLFFCATWGDRALVAVLCVYLFHIVKNQMFLNDDGDFKDQFSRAVFACILPVILSAVTMSWTRLSELVLPFVLITAVSGILLMRILRHSRDVIDSASFKASNILTVAFVCALALLASSKTLLGGIGSGLYFIYDKVIINILMAFVYGMARFLSLFAWLFKLIFHREVKFYSDGEDWIAGNMDEMIFEDVETHTPALLTWVFTGLLILGALALVFWGLRALAGRNRRFDRRSGARMDRQTIEVKSEPRRNPFARRDERDKVRHSYRRFLKECLQRGFAITPDFDTQQIAAEAEHYFPGAPLTQLRDLYRKARYTDSDVTKEEAREADRLYDRIHKTSFKEEK